MKFDDRQAQGWFDIADVLDVIHGLVRGMIAEAGTLPDGRPAVKLMSWEHMGVVILETGMLVRGYDVAMALNFRLRRLDELVGEYRLLSGYPMPFTKERVYPLANNPRAKRKHTRIPKDEVAPEIARLLPKRPTEAKVP